MDFSTRTGEGLAAVAQFPTIPAPQWWLDAKLGVFVHWGLYSLPAWAEVGSEAGGAAGGLSGGAADGLSGDAPRVSVSSERCESGTVEDAELESYRHHQYAEWIANIIRIPGSGAADYFYGPFQRDLRAGRVAGAGTPLTAGLNDSAESGEHPTVDLVEYEDLVDLWEPAAFDAGSVAATFRAAGARYVVPTAKHHDGFCLWDTATTDFNAARRGPGRDLIAEFEAACRDAGLRFGLYFSGALDWHESSFGPICANAELFTKRRNDADFARFAGAQLRELVEWYRPDVLWNDIDWPDTAKLSGSEDWRLANLLSFYSQAVPEGLVNDRWGAPVRSFITREYAGDAAQLCEPWEATRGLGLSFGVNARETEADILSGPQLVSLLCRTVARGGNLLLNVGLDGSGQVPQLYLPSLEFLGGWLRRNGFAVYASRPAPDLGAPTRERAFVRVGEQAFEYRFLFAEDGADAGVEVRCA